jgi:RNA-directed DNA polymerase
MNERGKSDNLVVPAKPPNNAGEPVAEVVEGRRLAEGNTDSSTRPGRSAGQGVPSGLDRVREVARRDKDARFTALLHHVGLDRLWAAYVAINPKAAPGVDQVTWDAYGQDLRGNLEDLLRRVHSGAYRASPSRRVYIPKPDGRQRPLGIATVTSYCLSCSRVSECSGLAAVRPCCRICWDEHGKWCRHFRGGLSGGGAWCAGLRG